MSTELAGQDPGAVSGISLDFSCWAGRYRGELFETISLRAKIFKLIVTLRRWSRMLACQMPAFTRLVSQLLRCCRGKIARRSDKALVWQEDAAEEQEERNDRIGGEGKQPRNEGERDTEGDGENQEEEEEEEGSSSRSKRSRRS
jgi:hypothetical protein